MTMFQEMTSSLERTELRYNRSHAAAFQRHGAPLKIMPQGDISFHNTANCEPIDLLIRQSKSGLGSRRTILTRSRQLSAHWLWPFADSTFCFRAVKLVCVVPNNQAWKNPGCFSKHGNNFKVVLMFDGHKLFWW